MKYSLQNSSSRVTVASYNGVLSLPFEPYEKRRNVMKASKLMISVLLLLALCVSMMSVTALADGAVAVVESGGSSVETASLTEAINTANPGDTVMLLQDCSLGSTLVIDKNLTVNLNGRSLTFTSSDVQDAAVLISGGAVTFRNGTVRAVSGDASAGYRTAFSASGGSLTLDNMYVRYSYPGGTMLSGGSITVYEGEYSQDPGAYMASGLSSSFDGDKYIVSTEVISEPSTEETPGTETETPETPGTETETETPETPGTETETTVEETTSESAPLAAAFVSKADGSALSSIYYYKNGVGMNGDKSYTVKPEPDKVLVYASDPNSAIALTTVFKPKDLNDRSQGGTLVISQSDNRSKLDALPAGAYYMEFTFKDAGSITQDLFVFLSASLDTDKHVKGSDKPIVASLSDEPESVLISDYSNMAGGTKLVKGTDYSYADGKLTLSSACLDKLTDDNQKTTKYVAFIVSYRGSEMAAPYQITLYPSSSIEPDLVSWKRGTEKSFTVKPDIKKVFIDSTELDAKNYSVSGMALTVKPAAIASLVWGQHTLTATTSSGQASAVISVEPSLGYSSSTGNQHVKDNSRNLIFIASDPVVKVYVNGEELGTDKYLLNDGSKNITLKASYLNTLNADTYYTITATVTNNGNYQDVSSGFKILPSGSKVPTTPGSSGGSSTSSGGSSSGGSSTSSGGSSSGGSSSGSSTPGSSGGSSTGYAGSPQTGDSSPILWIGLLLLAGIGVAVIVPKLRKE